MTVIPQRVEVVSFFHRPVSNSKFFENLTWGELFQVLTGPPIKLKRATAKEKAKHGDYFVRGLIKDGGMRNDKNLKKSNIIIIDIDKAIEGFPKPSPEEIASVAADIQERYNVPFVVHSSATPGNSRAIFLSKPFKRKKAKAITRFFYQQFRDRGCKFRFAGESSTFSQPWFIPQSTKPDTHFSDGIKKGKPFKWKKFVDFKKDSAMKGIHVASSQSKISDGTALERFLKQLKAGTIHNAALSYMGWLSRTTDLTYNQIVGDVTTLIESNYKQQHGEENKADRWQKARESGSLRKWFEKQNFDRANFEGDEDDEGVKRAIDGQVRKVSWLWKDIFHRSKFNLLAGDSGSNKTTFALRIASHVTTGKAFLGGKDFDPGAVLMITSEDDLEDTILPRLVAVGADLDNFFYTSDDFDFNSNGIKKLTQYIDDIYEKTGIRVKLVVCDPIDSYTGSANTNIGSIVKKICNQFNLFARKNDLCFLGIMHFKKVVVDGKNSLKNAIAGSYAWTSTPRSVGCMVSDPADYKKKYFGLVKNNNASIHYHFEMKMEIKKKAITIGVVEKIDEVPIEVKAISMLKGKSDYKIIAYGQRLFSFMKENDMELIPIQEARELVSKWSCGIKRQVTGACRMFKHKNISGVRYYIRDSYSGEKTTKATPF